MPARRRYAAAARAGGADSAAPDGSLRCACSLIELSRAGMIVPRGRRTGVHLHRCRHRWSRRRRWRGHHPDAIPAARGDVGYVFSVQESPVPHSHGCFRPGTARECMARIRRVRRAGLPGELHVAGGHGLRRRVQGDQSAVADHGPLNTIVAAKARAGLRPLPADARADRRQLAVNDQYARRYVQNGLRTCAVGSSFRRDVDLNASGPEPAGLGGPPGAQGLHGLGWDDYCRGHSYWVSEPRAARYAPTRAALRTPSSQY